MRHVAAALVMLAVTALPAHAEYPDPGKRITFVVPFSSGGSNDILARAVGQKLSEAWKLPVIIDNQVGASGSLGAARVAKSASDGYTILILSSTYTINSVVMSHLPFDPRTAFAPVAMLGKAPFLLAASKQVPAQNAKELIALARSKPGTLNYGSAGVGSVNQMAMELFKSLAGLEINHVPYRAGNTAVNDLIGGHVDLFVGSLPQMLELVRGGNATGIAVTSAKRSSIVPELPTLAESGVPGYELEQWWGVVVPAGTPQHIVGKLNAELLSILGTPEIQAFMQREGAEPAPSSPEELGRHIATELQRWTDLVERANLKVPD
jgi:tripartite-type tricarboxylate transporter receptor subunit TctC